LPPAGVAALAFGRGDRWTTSTTGPPCARVESSLLALDGGPHWTRHPPRAPMPGAPAALVYTGTSRPRPLLPSYGRFQGVGQQRLHIPAPLSPASVQMCPLGVLESYHQGPRRQYQTHQPGHPRPGAFVLGNTSGDRRGLAAPGPPGTLSRRSISAHPQTEQEYRR